MRRREIITFFGVGVVLPALSKPGATQPLPLLRVGMATIVPRSAPFFSAFIERMAELGYVEGKNFVLEFVQVRTTDGYEASFAEVGRRNVDIFVVLGNEVAADAARAAAGNRPIVLVALAFDPFKAGYADSLAHPGGNITGLFARQIELASKRVQIMREAFPTARDLGLLWDKASRDQAEASAATARELGFEPHLVEVAGEPVGPAAAFRLLTGGWPLVIPEGPVFVRDYVALAEQVIQRRMPAISASREHVEAGVLMSYGVNVVSAMREVADYVDRIAKGADPSSLPIREPTRFEFLVNLKSVKALELALPRSLVARADEVIE